MNTLTLTVREIADLAQFAGIALDETRMPKGEEMDAEITVGPCPESGLRDEEMPSTPLHYAKIAWLTEYPEEGHFGLGEQIQPNKADIQFGQK